ncbi:basal body-orientation factor 1 isoform X2 [Esox lucius]|uniref:Basal body-orientation factor 1 n=1 Tax=Esox lucius TaxID=8010 RepID=A0A3P8XRU7_ESOLU|nr:basal body-orientation factor 1 isoform X2 [Esox lucius]
MPKKKGKKGKKSKGKGKKEGKQESKSDKESDMEKAKANAALWEARLDVTEHSRVEYREAARRLARANEELTNQQYRAEKDTIDIIAFLKRKDVENEETITRLEAQLKSQKKQALEENEKLIAEYTLKVSEVEEKFKKRSSEFKMIQGELKIIKEFRKKKAQMEQELNSIKESMYIADREHKESLAEMEHKFFSEKVRLEKEAEQRIAQLAERAHNEAIVQLDDASRSVFKENVRLSEALKYHMKEVEDLRKMTVSLAEENASLAVYKETSELMLKEHVSQLRAQEEEIAELRGKLGALEQALGIMGVEFERDKTEIQHSALVSSQAAQVELVKLQKVLAMREKEIGRVKRLARRIVEQRTELECFFHEALGQVRQEIQASRLQYRQEALEAYRRRMSEARAGKQGYPRIRTFRQTFHSTNSVYSDLEEAEKWNNLQSNKVDISELTWEQKEKVLRLLFARMNGHKARILSQPLALSTSSDGNQNDTDPGPSQPLTWPTSTS